MFSAKCVVLKSYFILEKMSSSVEKIELSIIKHDDIAPQSGRSNEAAGKTISVTEVDERNDGLTENTELSQVKIWCSVNNLENQSLLNIN